MRTGLFIVIVAAISGQAMGDVVTAGSNATVKTTGPRTGTNGTNFFNVEGDVAGGGAPSYANASYGILRFDLGAIKAGWDTTYGVNNWNVSGAQLNLIEANAAFTHSGSVNVFLSLDNTTTIANDGSSPFKYDPASLSAGNNQGNIYSALSNPAGTGISDNQFLGALGLPTTGNINNGSVDSLTLPLSGLLLAALQSESAAIITIVIESADATTAGTFAGATNATASSRPQLVVNAVAAPAPGAMGVLALGGLLAARRRRS